MYEPSTVAVIDLTLSPEAIAGLEAEPEEYVKGAFTLAFGDGTPQGIGPPSSQRNVEVRLKGNVGGSFRPLTGKAAFKLKFKKSEPFLGLRKMTLNNMVQDPSMIHEILAYEAFRAAGVPAPRTGYAYVRLNGQDYGLSLNVEALDSVWLESTFGPGALGHLYEGALGTDLALGGAAAFEVDEGDPGSRADLEALIAAVAGDGEPFSQRIDGLADLPEMIRMWAVEKYIGHLDGYAGTEAPLLPNNFYLYADPAGEFQMLPWGTDATWVEHLPFEEDAGLLFDECIVDSACVRMYRESLVAAGEAIEARDLDSVAQAAAELLRPWQEIDPRREYGSEAIERAVEETREFVARRPDELSTWLSSSGGGQGAPPAEIRPESPSPADESRRVMNVVRHAFTAAGLVTRISLEGPGTVSQRVWIRTAEGAVGACRTEAKASAAATLLTLSCRLAQPVLRRLGARWLRLYVRTRFRPAVGSPEGVAATVLARRTAL